MAAYSCSSVECDGRIFDSREGTARCIHCGSEDIRRIDRPWFNSLVIILAGLLVVFQFFCFNVRWSGCKNENACNYHATALFNDSADCTFGTALRDCDGNCLRDTDYDGVCDANEVYGCTVRSACNFNKEATEADRSCYYADQGYNCAGDCLKDKDRDGICDSDEVYGCRDRAAYNFNDFATKDDGSCRYFSSDRKVNDENKAVFGCKDRAAYNFNDFATKDDGSCRYFSSVKEDKCENKLYHAVV